MSNTSLLGSYGGLGNAGLQFRNKLINGDMAVWQRGTSFTTAGGLPDGKGVYNSADRWKFLCTIMGTGYYNLPVNRSTDAPAGFAYSASVGNHYSTTDHLGVMQPIEGINCVELAESGVCTISVYLKKGTNAPAGKNITISLVQCKTTDVHGNFIDDVAVNYDVLGTQVTALDSLASWTRVTFTVTGLTANVARGLGVCFYISATDLTAGNDIFKFTGASLEAGPVATPFEHRPIGMELQLCQRYFEKGNSFYSAGGGFGGGCMAAPLCYKQEKRINNCTLTLNVVQYRTSGSWITAGAYIVAVNTSDYFTFYVTSITTTAALYIQDWTADAEL